MGRSRKERPDDLMDMTQVVGWRMSAARKSQGRTQEWVVSGSRFYGGELDDIDGISRREQCNQQPAQIVYGQRHRGVSPDLWAAHPLLLHSA